MKPRLFFTLLKLAEALGELEGPKLTASELAKRLGLPQQTFSRHLKELEGLGLIDRIKARRGETIKLTAKGLGELASVKASLDKALKLPLGEVKVEGEVFSGLGEGAYYVSQPGYRRQFVKKLGFDPFPGTLNLRVKGGDLEKILLLKRCPAVPIEGFINGGRSFGPAGCYKAVLEGRVEGAVVVAMRGHYGDDVLEVIAPVNLRKALNLKDGDKVSIKVFPTR